MLPFLSDSSEKELDFDDDFDEGSLSDSQIEYLDVPHYLDTFIEQKEDSISFNYDEMLLPYQSSQVLADQLLGPISESFDEEDSDDEIVNFEVQWTEPESPAVLQSNRSFYAIDEEDTNGPQEDS